MSEIASPAAVVEILITQKRTVTSGTFVANGCWLNTRSKERTLGDLLVWVTARGERRAARRPAPLRLMVTEAVQPPSGRAKRNISLFIGCFSVGALRLPDEARAARIHPRVGAHSRSTRSAAGRRAVRGVDETVGLQGDVESRLGRPALVHRVDEAPVRLDVGAHGEADLVVRQRQRRPPMRATGRPGPRCPSLVCMWSGPAELVVEPHHALAEEDLDPTGRAAAQDVVPHARQLRLEPRSEGERYGGQVLDARVAGMVGRRGPTTESTSPKQ